VWFFVGQHKVLRARCLTGLLMAYLTDDSSGLARAVDRSANSQYFTTVLGWLILTSVVTALYHASNIKAFNSVSNVLCISLIAYASYTVFRSSNNNATNIHFIAAACGFTLLSIVFNAPNASITDAIKYLSIYIFYAAGYACACRLRSIDVCGICVLATLPIIFKLTIGDSQVPEVIIENLGNAFSYLYNTNIAVLYFAALIFALSGRLGRGAIPLQFVNAVLMGKVGAAMATASALGLYIMFPLRKESALALMVAILALCIALWSGALDRVVAVLDSMRLLIDLGPDYISRMTFGRLVELTGTTDLSGFFRVIHWSNIWEIYWNSSLLTILFGYGIGQTINLTVMPYIPHNDYLRILAEYGLINLVVFVCFMLHVLRNLRTAQNKVLFMVLLFYFFSENLIDHFPSMTLYFTFAGLFAAMSADDDTAGATTLRSFARF
jgi:hypothetical protein